MNQNYYVRDKKYVRLHYFVVSFLLSVERKNLLRNTRKM